MKAFDLRSIFLPGSVWNGGGRILLIKCFLVFWLNPLAGAFAQDGAVLDRAVERMVDRFADLAGKNIRPGSRIFICPFEKGTHGENLPENVLSRELSSRISDQLKQKASTGKLSVMFITPDANSALGLMMDRYFVPTGSDEEMSRFFQGLLESERPNYYFWGEWRCDKDYLEFALVGMELVPDRYDSTLLLTKNMALPPVRVRVEQEKERDWLRTRDRDFIPPPLWLDQEERVSRFSADSFFTCFLSEKYLSGARLEEVSERLQKEGRARILRQIREVAESWVRGTPRGRNWLWVEPGLPEFRSELYVDESAGLVCVFSVLEKEKLATLSRTRSQQWGGEIEALLEQAARNLEGGQKTKALEDYASAYSLHARREACDVLAGALGAGSLPYNDDSGRQIREGLSRLQKNNYSTLEDLCKALAQLVRMQLPQSGHPVAVTAPTLSGTDVTGPFSMKFKDIFETILFQEAGLTIAKGTPPKDSYRVIGSVLQEHDLVQVIVHCLDAGGLVVASAEGRLAWDAAAKTEMPVQPDHFGTGMSLLQEMDRNKPESGDLVVDFFTEKGSDNLSYRKGEIMQISVVCNKPCFLRIVYYLADGAKILLIDNYQVSNDLVGKRFQLPGKFICGEPFGIEALQLFAGAGSFEALRTERRNQRDYILDQPAAIADVSTRGFALIPEYVERRIVISTMP